MIQTQARDQGVGSAVKELQGNVSDHTYQQTIIAHPERIFCAVAVGIPNVNSSRCTRIRRDKRRDREDAMAVFAAACCHGGDRSVAQP